ncbi:MAG TPA: DUF4230 domain-containing protein [Planococcus sp. (in: firmicutes)]|nr:DUF4230 domain-containing protein [Planococcus sp. (in: firmicutes)]
MSNDPKLDEIERLLKGMKRKEEPFQSGFWKTVKVMLGVWRNAILLIIVVLLGLMVALPLGIFWALQGSTFTESKGAFLEQIQDMNELTTAEAYSKVIIERQDNAVFGREIGWDLPGTQRQLLVVIPGSIRAGIDFSEVTADDIELDEENRTATLTLPPADFLGGAEIYMDQVEVYSYEGLFRRGADMAEAFELAEEAQRLIMEESAGQGVLERAQANAANSVRDMFRLVDYDVDVQFED